MSDTAYTPLIVGNWKMHKTIVEAKSFVEKLSSLILNSSSSVWLAVPFTAIQPTSLIAANSQIKIGAQNVNDHVSGAFTGEISCEMLEDAGASFVILGHSERRQIFHETDAYINKKLKRVLQSKLKAIVCVGETLEQHQRGLAQQEIEKQLSQSLEGLSSDELQNVILAYEPIWAIGTNLTATPDQAQVIHQFCRNYIARHWSNEVAKKMIILYGGSVKPDNAKSLIVEPDIDGLLVGGSSLSVESFSKIIDCCSKNSKN